MKTPQNQTVKRPDCHFRRITQSISRRQFYLHLREVIAQARRSPRLGPELLLDWAYDRDWRRSEHDVKFGLLRDCGNCQINFAWK
ncbi:hypothetical protein [Bradyrhizobium elkanii]|uniref:hypothetical protein n=1 Tax=Bradyrhizobium elkanii TaxID=29448 RepID=UPI001BA543DB|nr:hypothetical protein [Bradyrhizobium elkanii]MBR1162491.1 hypothetical protein [Bradyrhizobium elkanii]